MVGVADDETLPIELRVAVLGRPGAGSFRNGTWRAAGSRLVENRRCAGRTPIVRASDRSLPYDNNADWTHTSQFFSTRQLSPAAFSELHTPAAAFIDTKGPIEAR